MINDITRHQDDNLGGINSFRFIPVEGIEEIPSAVNSVIHYEVAVKTGYRWYDGYGTEGSMGFKDDHDDGDHGGFHNKSFVAKVPKERAEVIETLNSAMNRKFVLDITYNNGTRILAGTVKEPMRLVSKYDSKTSVPEYNGYDLLFSGQGVKRSPVYDV